MVRSGQIQLLLISVLAAGAAFGQNRQDGPQNNDLSILVGPVIGSTLATGGMNTPANFSGFLSFQSNFAHTLHSYSFGDLWWEAPSTFASRDSGDVGGVKSATYNEYFFTPGVRLHVFVGSRVSFYGAAGVGFCSFDYSQDSGIPGVHIDTQTTYHGVVDFGGGVDFRLTRLLSLRVDVRDFVTGRGLGGLNGQNHPIFGFGMAVHF